MWPSHPGQALAGPCSLSTFGEGSLLGLLVDGPQGPGPLARFWPQVGQTSE